MHGLAQPEEPFPPDTGENATAPKDRPGTAGSVADRSKVSDKLEGMELDAALQLLVERAQYITGATGTALALAQGGEMVCRASAGASAPAVGARLQVQSGLTGESVARRQLLRCDNAETDPRVNLEACRALGIASIVVLPLQRRNGEVRGLFELFSDHPYAFEERDLTALERMADLTMTALDLAEQRQSAEPPRGRPQDPAASVGRPPVIAGEPKAAERPAEALGVSSLLSPERGTVEGSTPPASSVPAAMLRVQKCASCGFPVSEGRTLCLDCEKKDGEKKDFQQKQRAAGEIEVEASEPAPDAVQEGEGEFVPAFLANSLPVKESWLSNHVNLLAIIVLILAILVAVVIFR
jgi:putative methionine-R-sulfoxide reductase with GAF domain